MPVLIAGPYCASTASLTATQQTLFTSLGAQIGHIDSGGEIPWPNDPDNFAVPVAAIQAWVISRFPTLAERLAYTGYVALDIEGEPFQRLYTIGGPNQASIDAQYALAVTTVRDMLPNAYVGIWNFPWNVPFEQGIGLPLIAPVMQNCTALNAAVNVLYPVFYAPQNVVPYTDAQYTDASLDIILGNSPDLSQGRPVIGWGWMRHQLDWTMLSEATQQAQINAAVNNTGRAYNLAGWWMWHPDEYAHTCWTLGLEPCYSALENEENFLGGAADWPTYREIRGARGLTILSNALYGTSLPLPSFGGSVTRSSASRPAREVQRASGKVYIVPDRPTTLTVSDRATTFLVPDRPTTCSVSA